MTADSYTSETAPAHADWTRVLFEAIDDAVFVHDAQGNILEANPAACRRLGYSRAELLRLTTRDVDAPEFASGFKDRLSTQLHDGHFRCEGVHRTKDGRLIPVDINTSAVTLDGQPAVLAVMRDITERKLSEERLNKQGQLLRSILDNMGDAVLVTDLDRRIFIFNPAAERVFGPGLLQGAFQLYLPDRVTRVDALPLDRCIRGESFDQEEVFVRHSAAPKGLWGSLTGRPLRDRGGAIKGAVLACRDITGQKSADSRLRAQYFVARVLAKGGPVEEVARHLLQVLCEALEFDVGVWWSVEGPAPCCLEVWQPPDPSLADFLAETRLCIVPGASELPVEVQEQRRPLLCDVETSIWAPDSRWQTAAQAGLRHALAFPVQSGGNVLAVLEFWSSSPEDGDEQLVATMQATGDQVGQFLERQRFEAALRDSESLYVSLVDNLPQNIFRKDAAGRFTFANRRICESLHRTPQEMLGKTDHDLFAPEVAAMYVADDRHIMESGQTLDQIEAYHPAPDETRYIHVVKTPLYDGKGEVAGVQGIFWDVTEQVAAERAVAESEKRYRQLTEATMDGIMLLDRTGRIDLFNPAAERMFGCPARDVLGKAVTLLLPEEFSMLCDKGVRAYLEERADVLGRPQECQGRRKDGTLFPVEIALSFLRDSDRTSESLRFLVALRDLTERNKMRAILIQNEKLASIGLLSAGVAHEINNPLAFVGNNLVVLERDCKGLLAILNLYRGADGKLQTADPDTAGKIKELSDEIDIDYIRDNLDRLLSRTRDGVERVTRIVHSLRGMARTDAPRCQNTRLPDLVESSLEILRGRFKRLGVVVEQHHDANPFVPCVATQISQVLLNLLVNAFQAIETCRPEGGKVVVRTHRQGEDMVMEVEDNGCGIPAENMPKLYDPFFTTKDVGEGTGLGLSITHHIVTAHGGRIEVESTPGQGTCFRIYLPLQERKNRP